MPINQFEDISKTIDHTLLKANVTKDQIKKLCEEARAYEFASVCVNPFWVSYASEQLEGTTVKVCTVIGFPLGASTTEVKAYETKDAIHNGATEIDMVINIGALKAGDEETVKSDIQAVTAAARGKALVKVIIETSFLTDEEKEKACRLAVEAGAHYVKTSTGFSDGGATLDDVQLMRKTVGADLGVKASGGVRTHEDAVAMIQAGATRIGTSSGVNIVQDAKTKTSK
ncbi:deoxyribose-phosphate aldolase [Bacillus thermotolerans]|uniref:Deoxyribose-phosphate aldolase n=1 Tax=Bacillus thermotolerans TaxID=1221996 RepID=A0A0F5IDE8_BACTR|nr:deoxyribose-phosphate aldolase [Bacillus thermotolerans]KKB36421.1 Deoxyribose-phosphate aldolase [Bacillus thermotolerans]KKB43197.1 Deoxyribose-phosphate aldolase [Bacillus thermotolerans]KKB43600.1 Deoxyribose-phosphate aldolase [Bacillus thermotolerans]